MRAKNFTLRTSVCTWHINKGLPRLLIFGGTLVHYGIASYMQKHHYFYVVHFLSTSKGVGNQTINAARLPLAPHAPHFAWAKKKKKSHDALTSFLSLFIFVFVFRFFLGGLFFWGVFFSPSNLSFIFLIILYVGRIKTTRFFFFLFL